MATAIIFDLDGTLLDTLQDLTDATNHALAAFGYPPRTAEEVRGFVGNGARTLIRLSLPEGADPAMTEAVLAVYQPYYRDHCQAKTCPYPGIPAALEALGEKYPLAIVSNKPDAATKALAARYFPGVFALGEGPQLPRKPAPDMVRRAMAALGVERAVYVGDSEVDILTAQNAGVPCLSVSWGFRSREALEKAGARHLCHSGADLAAALEAMADAL